MRTEIYGIAAGRRHQDRPRGLLRPQSKIAPPTAPCCTCSKSAAKARRTVVLRARSRNGQLRPAPNRPRPAH